MPDIPDNLVQRCIQEFCIAWTTDPSAIYTLDGHRKLVSSILAVATSVVEAAAYERAAKVCEEHREHYETIKADCTNDDDIFMMRSKIMGAAACIRLIRALAIRNAEGKA